MSKRVDVAKLARIALCFAGVLMIVSGLESGLTSLANRTLFYGHDQMRDIIFYVVGMILFCPLAFGKAAIGLCCIRWNRQLVRFCEKYSRKQVRIGLPAWKSPEIHALCCAFFGMLVLYHGMAYVIAVTLIIIDRLCFASGDFHGVAFFVMTVFVALPFYLIPGGLLIRFAKKCTAIIRKKLAKFNNQ